MLYLAPYNYTDLLCPIWELFSWWRRQGTPREDSLWPPWYPRRSKPPPKFAEYLNGKTVITSWSESDRLYCGKTINYTEFKLAWCKFFMNIITPYNWLPQEISHPLHVQKPLENPSKWWRKNWMLFREVPKLDNHRDLTASSRRGHYRALSMNSTAAALFDISIL